MPQLPADISLFEVRPHADGLSVELIGLLQPGLVGTDQIGQVDVNVEVVGGHTGCILLPRDNLAMARSRGAAVTVIPQKQTLPEPCWKCVRMALTCTGGYLWHQGFSNQVGLLRLFGSVQILVRPSNIHVCTDIICRRQQEA